MSPLLIFGGALVLIGAVASTKKVRDLVSGALDYIVPDRAVYGFDYNFDTQKFLESKGSALATKKIGGFLGFGGTAASQIVHDVALSHNVKPQYLLAAMEREQGLISGENSKKPTDHAIDWATGYGAWHGKPESQWATQYKGFEKQLVGAATAANQAKNGTGPYAAVIPAVVNKTPLPPLVDGTLVIPKNVATGMFYVYTPTKGVGSYNRAIYSKHFPQLLA